ARPERRAKPAAKTVLPVPARPLIMFALYEARLFSSSFSRRGRGTRPRLSRNCDLFVDEMTLSFFMSIVMALIPQRVFRVFCCRMYRIWERFKLSRRPLEEFLRFDCDASHRL